MASQYVLSQAVRRHGWGWSNPRPWETTYQALREADLLGGETDPASVWTNEYLDADYRYVGEYAAQVSPPEATTSGGTTAEETTTGTTSGGRN
ncbi:hypothetical protein [Halorussus caseinilyticus]|uniref:Uncharacterized protein n=2 Tax=Halorussus caseinilyticus TaxID=3034025 RepID=A0ABD5WJ67_9EURY